MHLDCLQCARKGYWEYSAGIGNIFKIFRIDFAWRANYLNVPETNFTIKGSFDLISRSYSMRFNLFLFERKKGKDLHCKRSSRNSIKIDIK
jgi:hypothetical protein